MQWIRYLAVLTIFLLLGSQEKIFAQGGGMTSGGAGVSTGGSSMFGGSSGGNSATTQFGTNATTSTSNTLTANNAGITATVGGQALTSNNGFIGANTSTNQSQQGFVGGGNTAAATQNGTGMGGMGGGMGGMGGGMGGGMNGMGGGMNNMGGQGNMGNNAAQTTPVRIAMKIGFTPRVGQSSRRRLVWPLRTALIAAALHWQSPARVEMTGRKAILRGVVAYGATTGSWRAIGVALRPRLTRWRTSLWLPARRRRAAGEGYDGVAGAGGA